MANKQAVLSSSINWATSNLVTGECGQTVDEDDMEDIIQSRGPGEPSASLNYTSLKKDELTRRLSEGHKSLRGHFQRVKFTGAAAVPSDEQKSNCHKLRQALGIRKKWVFEPTKLVKFVEPSPHDKPVLLNPEQVRLPPKADWKKEMIDGVYMVWQEDPETGKRINVKKFADVKAFFDDLVWIMELISLGSAKTFCYKRLRLLQTRFHLHNMLNEQLEREETRNCPHRDFYNVRKVDNHVHHSACMNQKHLLRFIKSRVKRCPNVVVVEKDGELVTLAQLFKQLGVKPHDLSIDTLDMHAHQDTFHRFDRFNLKYNPIGSSELRTLFLKTDNYMKGRFFAEVTKEVFDDLESAKYQNAEYRLSIYGKNPLEWDKLASWVCRNNLQANHVKWMIQIPRIYTVYRKANMISNFKEMLDNIFRPLFEVTIDPSTHPELHLFLKLVVGFDTVDDESKPERKRKKYPKPEQWNSLENPPYIVYSYYLYGNLYVLNALREARGMSTFMWRPHCGESGDLDHLAVSFMIAESIQHGITLKRSPVLQYLYYISQIGISMSPLSNNLLFLEYHKNPFPLFFTRGLNVTLSTDDPLMIHFTKEPLVEEYSIAAQLWKLSNIDMCEIARNSVLISGFSHSTKCHWLGQTYDQRGPSGNCIEKTNVPNIRLLFRQEMLQEEESMLCGIPCSAFGIHSPTFSKDCITYPESNPPLLDVTEKRPVEDTVQFDHLRSKLALLPNKDPRSRESNLNLDAKKSVFCLAFGIIVGMAFVKIMDYTKLKRSSK